MTQSPHTAVTNDDRVTALVTRFLELADVGNNSVHIAKGRG